jgi:5-methylcytosine-specific restriction endonuclease McrA
MKKTSIIWKISKNELQSILDNSNSYSQALLKLGFKITTGGPYRTLIERIKIENLNTKILENNRQIFYKSKNPFKTEIIPLDEVLIKESNYSRHLLKKRLIKNNILEYKCSLCSLKDTWNGKKISLQLDHINGINNDNRIQNLRFLCPNCHSQTNTYSGKNNKKQVNFTKKNFIQKNNRKRKFEITKEELINLIKQHPMTKVGEILGVSDNAIRKRCRTLEIDYKNL